MVTIQNISRRAVTILADHVSFQEKTEGSKIHHQTIRRVTVDHAKTGKLTARIKPLLVPTSITLLSGERRALPDAILKCKDVVKGIARRELRITAQPSEKSDKPAAKPAKGEE